VRLLFDENCSPTLPRRLRDLFPDSVHLRALGLRGADDARLWQFARDEGFTIVTKDRDFARLPFVHGFPPHVVWLRLGNTRTTVIEAALRESQARITAFVNDGTRGVLEVWPRARA
jgi:predicted nuclease of predicted toxin-antitoxin system